MERRVSRRRFFVTVATSVVGIGALHGIQAAADRDPLADGTQRPLVPSIQGTLIGDAEGQVIVRTAAGMGETVRFPSSSASSEAATFIRDGVPGRANFRAGDDVVAELRTDHRPLIGSALLTSYGFIGGQVQQRSTDGISTTGGKMLVADDTIVERRSAPQVRVPSWSIRLGESVRASVIRTPSGELLARQIAIDDRP